LYRYTTVYPHEPPKVKCTQKLYHPNLDYDGIVCLTILREVGARYKLNPVDP
jgi:ubiquitin-conjugating enzyme E2 M